MPESLWCAAALLPEGWARAVRLDIGPDGHLAAVTCDAPPQGLRRLDGWVLPGMPNLHSHGFQRALVGLTGARSSGRDDFWNWRQALFALAERIDPDTLEALLGGLFAELLEGGYTSCAEFHYLHHAPGGRPYADVSELSRRVLRAAAEAGMPLTLLPVWYQRAGFDAPELAPAQRRFQNDLDGYLELLEACRVAVDAQASVTIDSGAEPRPGARLGIAPHSLRAVPPEQLAELSGAVETGSEDPLPVHLHIAEQRREVADCVRHLGSTPVAWLITNLSPDRHWCLVHATHTTAKERAAAAGTGVVAGLCPSTEADLGDGIFDAVDWVGQSGAFGVGSDSNLRLDAVGELRLLEFTQRLREERRNLLSDGSRSCGRWLYEEAARGGARAIGQRAGALAPGLRADLVELDPGHRLLEGLVDDQCLDAYVFGAGPGLIRSVWTSGVLRVDRGRHREAGRLRSSQARALGQLRSATG